MREEDVERLVALVVKEALRPRLDLRRALDLMERVEEEASRMGVAAVVAVSNEAARPVAVHCMDNSYIASYDVAVQKAYTAAALKMSTLELKKLSRPGDSLYGIQFTNKGQIVIFGGGVPLVFHGKLIGGLGVSGGTEEQDSALAQFGADCLEEVMMCR